LQNSETLSERFTGQVSGRYTLIGLYSFYILKELRLKQTEFWKYAMLNLADYPIDWYIKSSVDRQLIYNGLFAIVFSILLLSLRRLLINCLSKARKDENLKKD